MSWQIKLRAVSHKINLYLGTHHRGIAPMIFVLGFPKSGTTWGCQLVADYTEKPFPRHNLLPTACAAVIHGHELIKPNMTDVVYMVRDGRDCMVSLYNMLVLNYPEGKPLNRYLSRTLPDYQPGKPVANMAGFVRMQAKLHHAAPCNWSDHVIRSMENSGDNLPLLRYEQLLGEDPVGHLASELAKLTGEEPNPQRANESLTRYEFGKQSKKKAQGVKHFLNKGQAGNWRNYFTRETAQIFADTMGQGLIAAGYEPDNSWVDTVPETLDEPTAEK